MLLSWVTLHRPRCPTATPLSHSVLSKMPHCCLRHGSVLSLVSNFQSLVWLCDGPVSYCLSLGSSLSSHVSRFCSLAWFCIIPGISLPLTGVALFHPRCLSIAHWGGSTSFKCPTVAHWAGSTLYLVSYCYLPRWLNVVPSVPLSLTEMAHIISHVHYHFIEWLWVTSVSFCCSLCLLCVLPGV